MAEALMTLWILLFVILVYLFIMFSLVSIAAAPLLFTLGERLEYLLNRANYALCVQAATILCGLFIYARSN